MLNKTILFVCFNLVVIFSLIAQIGVNKFFINHYTPERYYDTVVKNDTILTLGVGFSKIKEKRTQGIVFTKFDSAGTIIKSKIFMDSIRGSLSVFSTYGNIINTKDGGYICVVAVQKEEIVLMLKLNKNLDIEFIKEFQDPAYQTNFDYNILEINKGYLLYGNIQLYPKSPNSNGQVSGFVQNIDTEGNSQWIKYYNPSTFINDIVDLKIINDSSFVLLMNSEIQSDPFDPTVFNNLMIIDSKGSTLKTWRSQNRDSDYYYIDKIIGIENDEILVFGHKFIDIYFKGPVITDRNFLPYIAAFDAKTLTPKWQKYIGIKSNADFVYNGLNDFSKTIDNNYIGVGNMGHSDYLVTNDSKLMTWLCKFSAQGDEIWSRKIDYPSNLPDTIKPKDKEAGFLNAVGVLSSGSIIAAGHVWAGNSTYGYLVKMTNDGCLDTLFKCDKTTEVKEEIIDNQSFITIYPNPTNDNINIVLDKNLGGYEVILRDLSGRIIQTSYIPSLLLTKQINLPSSNILCILELRPNYGKSTFHKIILID